MYDATLQLITTTPFFCEGKEMTSRSDWMTRDVPLFLPSSIFSRMDSSMDYAYRDRPHELKRRRDNPKPLDSTITVCRQQINEFAYSGINVHPRYLPRCHTCICDRTRKQTDMLAIPFVHEGSSSERALPRIARTHEAATDVQARQSAHRHACKGYQAAP